MSHGFGVESGDCKLRHVNYNQRFKLKDGDGHFLRIVQEIDAKRNSTTGKTEVKVHGYAVPAFWLDWDTVVEVVPRERKVTP